MNSQTRQTLNKITWGVPRNLSRNLLKKVVDTSEEDKARAALSDRGISRKAKEELKRMIDSGSLRREETMVDEKVASEIERYHSNAIKQAISNGKLEDPNKDGFVRDRQRKIHEHEKS